MRGERMLRQTAPEPKPNPNVAELWAARDNSGSIWGYKNIPTKQLTIWIDNQDDHSPRELTALQKDLPALASLRWEDKPVKVTLEVRA